MMWIQILARSVSEVGPRGCRPSLAYASGWCLLAIFFADIAHAQTYPISKKARDLIEKAINAHGGKAAMEKLLISTWKGRGLMYREDREPDRPVPFFAEWHARLPSSYKYTFSLKGIGGNLPISTAWSEGKGWRTLITGRGADDLPEKLANEEAEEAHVLYLTRLTPLLSGDYQLTVMPVAQRDNRFIIGLKVDAKGHRSCLLFFDRSTGLLTFVDRKVFDPLKKEDVSQETSYLNFKPMGGAIMAQSITIKRGKKLYMELELDRIDPKDDIPKSVFEKPPEPKD
ncbi:MAG: hypothetical protein U0796_22215 [Gemmatales bacterium]